MTIFSRLSSPTRFALAALAATAVVVLGWTDVATAHTAFDSSAPSNEEVVVGPLDRVVVNFTNPAQPSGDGFELLDSSGTVIAPSSLDVTDGTSFVLRFDPPLGSGTYGVRWKVQAGDAHPIDGSFVFDVTEPVGDTPSIEIAAPVATDITAPSEPESDGTVLTDLLADNSTGQDAEPLGRAGRAITFVGTIFGVGALAALVWVVRGRRDEIQKQLAWIRLAGFVIATGGLIELAALEATQSLSISDLATTKPGLAAILKMAGGSVVWFGFHTRVGQVIAPAHSLSAAVVADLAPQARANPQVGRSAGEHRWAPNSSAAIGLTGYAVVLVSFWFDGHTVSKGPWALHSLSNLVHLGAAAVWGGGVFAMTAVAWQRRRRSEPADLAAMVIRFSTLATASLIAVIVAGLTMTLLILESPDDLVGTTWGRLLIAKTVAVGVAAAMGAYNHFRLRPALERAPDDPVLARELRVSLTVESVVFGVVLLLTAWLVAAAT